MNNPPVKDSESGKYMAHAASWADVNAIVDLRNASSQSILGTDVTAVHWQKRHWYESDINLASDSMVLQDGESVVAYVELVSEPPYILHEMVGAVHPDYRRRGLGTQLVRWAENRARQSIEKAPKEAAIFIQTSIFEQCLPPRDLLSANQFTVVRDFVHLKIDMSHKPPDPVWPAGIDVRTLRTADWEKVGQALSEAFDDHWGNIEYDLDETQEKEESPKPDPRKTDPEAFDPDYFNSPGLCFVAWDGDQIVGSCLCNATTVEYPGAGYLGSLSIRRPWRRRGIGLALTLHALNAYYERGTTQVGTDTDGDSLTKAYRIYQNTGMKVFRHELVFEKMVRPGRDLVKRKMPNLQESV